MLTTRTSRGSALVMAMFLIVAAAILVTAVGNGTTTSVIQNRAVATDTELMYAAAGFMHMLKVDMTNGVVGNDLAPYNMDGANQSYSMTTTWKGSNVSTAQLKWRLTSGPANDAQGPIAAGEKRLLVQAQSQVGAEVRTIQMSVLLKQTEPLESNWFGTNIGIGPGLTINTPVGVRGDVNIASGANITSGSVTLNADVEVQGDYKPTATTAGSGTVHENADVPNVTFDIDQMVNDLSQANSGVVVNNFTKSGGIKGIRLRFSGAAGDENVVYISTANSDDNSVQNPFGAETRTVLTYGTAGALLKMNGYNYVVVDGTYQKPVTVLATNGVIHIAGDLVPKTADVPAIGLIAADTPDDNPNANKGSVVVRRSRNSQDYGFATNGNGTIEARIYAKGSFKGFAPGNNGKISSLTLKASLVVQGGGTDLFDVATNRTYNGPTNSNLTPPGMDKTRIVATSTTPKFKAGSWNIGFN